MGRKPCDSCASGGVTLIQAAARTAEELRVKGNYPPEHPCIGWAFCLCGGLAIAMASSRISLDDSILRRGTVCRWDKGESVVVVEVKGADVTIAGADHYARTLESAEDYKDLTLDMLDATTRAQVAAWVLKQLNMWDIVLRERNYSIVLQAAQDFAEMSEQQIDTLTRLALLLAERKA